MSTKIPGAVIVAAGMSSRMHSFKPMLPLAGATVIRTLIGTLQKASIAPIIVVTGRNGRELTEHILDTVSYTHLDVYKRQPVMVCACQTCLRLFRHFLPEIETVSLYEVLSKSEQLQLPSYADKDEYAVVDPCSAKFDEQARPSVCALLDKMGVSYQLLYKKIQEMPCCGFGGNIVGANPELAEMMRKNRVEADPRPYIASVSYTHLLVR